MKVNVVVPGLILLSNCLFSQTLPGIFETVPKEVQKSAIFISFPRNTWLENLVRGSDNALYLTDYPSGKIYRVTMDGSKELYCSVKGKIAGIVQTGDKSFLVTGWDEQNKAAIFKIDSKRQVSKLTNIPSGQFPNGILLLKSGEYLIADSYSGCLWKYDEKLNSVSVWLSDPLLARTSAEAKFPAANGIKKYQNKIYVSNTEKQILIEIPVLSGQAGKPVIYRDSVNIDDFDFDNLGNIYAATNVYNSVIKISQDKKVIIIADLSSGVAGCTAVLFHRTMAQHPVLYVTTNGGMAMPPPTGIEEGKVVKIILP